MSPDGGSDREEADDGSDTPDGSDDTIGDAEQRRKRRTAVRPHERRTASDSTGSETDTAREARDQWAPEGVDPEDVPWYFSPVSVDDPNPPAIVDRLGSVGIVLVAIALVLAVIGVAAAAVGIQPFGNAAITLSLGLGAIAMLFGLVFQAFASDLLSRSE